MKVAVYTCITGGYDAIEIPQRSDPRIDYHFFSDTRGPLPAPWKLHHLAADRLSAKDRNRYVKMHPHKLSALNGYDLTIYIDGSIRIVGDVFELAERCWNGGRELYVYDHPFRRCLYDEARECARIGHAGIGALALQMRRYRSAGFPPRSGLFEANVLIRNRSPLLDRTMALWWSEYRAGPRRDQLSLTYAAWRCGLTIAALGASDPRFGHRYFELMPHRNVLPTLQTSLRGRLNRAVMRLAPWWSEP